MDCLRRYMSFVTRLPIGFKLGMLLFFAHMDESLRQSYLDYSRKLQKKSRVRRDDRVVVVVVTAADAHAMHPKRRKSQFKHSVAGARTHHQVMDEFNQNSDPTGMHSLSNLWPGFKHFRVATNCLLVINFLKYLSVTLMRENIIFPLEWNCYLPGRTAIQYTLIKFVPMLATILIGCQIIWRYLAQFTNNNNFALDMIIFLLSDNEIIEMEKARVAKINETMRAKGNGNVIELQTVLQRVLFYRVTSDERTIYRLKPNRSREMKMFLASYIDAVCCLILMFIATVCVVCIPFMAQCLVFDVFYVRNYPTCCPLLEKLDEAGQLSQWDATISRCKYRYITILFDLFENIFLLSEAICVYTLPLAMGVLSALDLGLYWLAIDSRVKDLLDRYRQKDTFELPRSFLAKNYHQQHYSQHKQFLDPQTDFLAHYSGRSQDTGFELCNFNDPLYGEVINTQALIMDFFANFRRCNRFSGKIITFSVVLFFAGILICSYCSTKLPDYWDLIYFWFLMSIGYLSFFLSSVIMLYLKRILDQSYPNICSLMALEKPPNSLKWIHVVEVYVHRHGTAYSLIGNVQFTWKLVFNMIASSISCFILLETYKRYYYANLKIV